MGRRFTIPKNDKKAEDEAKQLMQDYVNEVGARDYVIIKETDKHIVYEVIV